jgi:hypothetical protein
MLHRAGPNRLDAPSFRSGRTDGRQVPLCSQGRHRLDGQPAGRPDAGRVGALRSWGSRCPTIRTAGRSGRIPAGGARVTRARNAAARLVGPVPRDRVTPPCCGRGSVTRSFSCRSAGGRGGTGSSTGHTGHRSAAASMVRRRAEPARSPLPGSGPPDPNAVPRRCGTGVAPRISRCRRDCHGRGAYQVNPRVHLPLTR